jgi:hypothetical protein
MRQPFIGNGITPPACWRGGGGGKQAALRIIGSRFRLAIIEIAGEALCSAVCLKFRYGIDH